MAIKKIAFSQPLIGEDAPMLWWITVNTRFCKDLWLTSGTFTLFLNTSYINIMIPLVINLSERALLSSRNLFTWSHKLVCGYIQASRLITELHSCISKYSVNIPGEYLNTICLCLTLYIWVTVLLEYLNCVFVRLQHNSSARILRSINNPSNKSSLPSKLFVWIAFLQKVS